jgi:ferrochelatase
MAYGSPAGESEVEAYLSHIRGGRKPSPEAVEELRQRYRAIGGSPLVAITRDQAAAVAAVTGVRAYVGMKHAPPFIREAVADAQADGVERLIGLPLAPHYARMSLGGYESAIREAWAGELVFVHGFHDHPAFTASVRSVLAEALAGWEPERIFFTAHSLPERIVREGDDYPARLLESARLVAEGMDLPDWDIAFQSASHTGEPWLGPDLLEAIDRSAARRVLVCPIGFVADHLEILNDLDVEAQNFARGRGIDLRRTTSLNVRPDFIDALARVVEGAVVSEGSGWLQTRGMRRPEGLRWRQTRGMRRPEGPRWHQTRGMR